MAKGRLAIQPKVRPNVGSLGDDITPDGRLHFCSSKKKATFLLQELPLSCFQKYLGLRCSDAPAQPTPRRRASSKTRTAATRQGPGTDRALLNCFRLCFIATLCSLMASIIGMRFPLGPCLSCRTGQLLAWPRARRQRRRVCAPRPAAAVISAPAVGRHHAARCTRQARSS
jgi:hypothetical protein